MHILSIINFIFINAKYRCKKETTSDILFTSYAKLHIAPMKNQDLNSIIIIHLSKKVVYYWQNRFLSIADLSSCNS